MLGNAIFVTIWVILVSMYFLFFRQLLIRNTLKTKHNLISSKTVVNLFKFKLIFVKYNTNYKNIMVERAVFK